VADQGACVLGLRDDVHTGLGEEAHACSGGQLGQFGRYN
jgi:hypothetical protein